jgi:hypothetical protein
MSDDEVKFLSRAEAGQVVAAIQEEEDIHKPGHRILTIYNKDNKEICWFDFEEVLRDVGKVAKSEEKDEVAKYIMTHIPDWALDM